MKSWQTWTDEVAAAVRSVPDSLLEQAARTILAADIVLTAGNGGSSALASHAAQAIVKPCYKSGGGRPAFCLTDNRETLTAHANDGGWENALFESARPYLEKHRCVLVLFSSSGNSENLMRLAIAGGSHWPIIGFTGFDGGRLRAVASSCPPHISIHVDNHDYEVVEPVHDALLHRVQYHLRVLQGI